MLASQELIFLITALGTGIGEQFFNLKKLRYHKIIIMTDADVDGSHIRTLLLTFFFRYFRVMIEEGHIYIAQPPLFKVKKGRNERYLKDQRAFDQYLFKVGCKDVKLQTLETPFEGEELETLIEHIQNYKLILDHFRDYDSRALSSLMMAKEEDIDWVELFEQHDKLKAIAEKAGQIFKQREYEDTNFEIELIPEETTWKLELTTYINGIAQKTKLDKIAIQRKNFYQLEKISKELRKLGKAPYTLITEKEEIKVLAVEDLSLTILNLGQKGREIQRYKGLGEMNPDQLWETTMNPDNRTLFQVELRDAIEADRIFTTLMGDQVEDRRKFIEDNALNVRNLDI